MAIFGTAGDAEAVLKIRIDGKQAETDMQLFSRSATAAFDTILEANQRFVAAIERGGRAGDIFASLSIGITQAQRASGGLVSQTNLAIAANRAQQAGLNLTERQFAALTAAARRFADATGGDTTQAMDQLTRAIVSGSSRALKQFGIDLGSSQDRIVKAEEALGKLERRFGDAEIAADDAADQILRVKNSISDVTDQLYRGLAENGALTRGLGVFANMAEQMSRLSTATDGWGQALRGLAGGLGSALGGITPLVTALGALEDVGNRLDLLTGQTGQTSIAFDETTGDAGIPGRQSPHFFQAPSTGQNIGRRGVNTRPNTSGRRGGGGGGGSGTDWTARFREFEREAAAERKRTEQADMASQANAAREWFDLQKSNEDAIKQIRLENLAELTQAQNDATQQWIDAEERHADAVRELAVERKQQLKDLAMAGMQNVLVNLLQGKSAKEAIKGGLEATMIVAAQKALFETGEAIAAAARYDAFAAAEHATSAGIFGSIALGAGLGAMAMGTRGRSRRGGESASSSAAFAPRTGLADTGGGGPVNVTVVMGPGGVVMGMDDDTLRRLGGVVREAQRRGHA